MLSSHTRLHPEWAVCTPMVGQVAEVRGGWQAHLMGRAVNHLIQQFSLKTVKIQQSSSPGVEMYSNWGQRLGPHPWPVGTDPVWALPRFCHLNWGNSLDFVTWICQVGSHRPGPVKFHNWVHWPFVLARQDKRSWRPRGSHYCPRQQNWSQGAIRTFTFLWLQWPWTILFVSIKTIHSLGSCTRPGSRF